MRWHLLSLVMLMVCAAHAQKPASSKSDLDCLSCHNDSSLTSDSGGTTHSLFVDGTKFGNSVHRILGCTDCHADVKSIPHDPVPAKVNCAACHVDAQAAFDRSAHAKARGQSGV